MRGLLYITGAFLLYYGLWKDKLTFVVAGCSYMIIEILWRLCEI